MPRFNTKKTAKFVEEFKNRHNANGPKASDALYVAKTWGDMASRLELERHYNRFYSIGMAVYIGSFILLPPAIAISVFAYSKGIVTGRPIETYLGVLCLAGAVITFPIWKRKQAVVFAELADHYPDPKI